ncbi:MAG: alpha/beta hydrolase [Verrucomicrobia bacterium]|nr:alpha/beta hydrolase [Verrucomicrobiota bacterium]
MHTPLLASVVALTLGVASLLAADAPAKAPAKAAVPAKVTDPEFRKYPLPIEPDENVSYGSHRMQRIYFWRAKSDMPTPLLFYIHGGGWTGGDRSVVRSLLKPALDAGISVVSVEYRTIKDSTADGLVPPVKGPMFDCARALQFTRSKAKEWNLDKTKVALAGGSAGACTSLWLAFHDDLADPQSADPIARESTRVTCAAVGGAQTSLDPKQMREWTPNSKYGAHAFGIVWDAKQKLSSFDMFYAERERILPWIKEYSPYELVSRDDPPVGLFYTNPPNLGKDEKDPTHTANFGVKLKEHCDAIQAPCELVYPGAPNIIHATDSDYIKAHLLPSTK